MTDEELTALVERLDYAATCDGPAPGFVEAINAALAASQEKPNE